MCAVLGCLCSHKTTISYKKESKWPTCVFITKDCKMVASHGFVPSLAPLRGLPVHVRCHGYPRVEAPTMTSLQWSVQQRLVKGTLLQGHSSLNKPGSSIWTQP